LLREAREGIPLTNEEFWNSDAIIVAGIKKGQHLYHIMQTNEISFSKSTAYRHLNRGYLSVSRIDFPRVVKFKPRKQIARFYVPKALREGRSYSDFLSFVNDNELHSWVEMDTIIGRIGGKVILSFTFTSCNFVFALLLDDKSVAETSRKIIALKSHLLSADLPFGKLFPVLLTGNGSEFCNIFAFINDLNGDPETFLFFCDLYHATQKPNIKKSHTLFRDIVPKGDSFDRFNQDNVNTIFSHINSVKRKSLNGKSPFEVFSFLYGSYAASLLGICEIPPADVLQSPRLIHSL
jgi:IS30 family transposase